MEADAVVLAGLRRLAEDDRLFCQECLKIKPKVGDLVPFVWNRAQEHISAKLEEQLRNTGKVRALLLKGRQQGGSTLISARFYKKTTMNRAVSACIIAHEAKATANLFKMVKRFHENNPLAPSTSASNAQELMFNRLDGGYQLATAGTQDVGRSATAQLLHGSEFAFWSNASEHLSGIGNIVSDEPGTEIILESTGMFGTLFHTMWQRAERGVGEYIPIFVPWFWQPEYQAAVSPGLVLTDEEREYMEAFGLSMAQMQWRANKIATYDEGKEWLFDREYPAAPEYAWRAPSGNPIISPAHVNAAAKSDYMDKVGPLIIGCDPASDGVDPDDTAIAWRRGRVVLKIERHTGKDEMQVAGLLARYWMQGDDKGRVPDGIIIDKGGIGGGIVSRLRELNIPAIGVNFAESATDPDTYANIRAEMYYKLRDWFKDKPVRIPNDAGLISACCATQPKDSSNGRKACEKKAEVKKRLKRSPDEADALALTFAYPVEKREAAAWAAHAGHSAPNRAGY